MLGPCCDNTMSNTLKRNIPFLNLLAQSGQPRRKHLLSKVSRSEVQSVCEICLNILKGHIPLDKHNYKRLKRKQGTLRQLADKKISVKHKTKLVKQQGGFIASLASIALPIIASLLKTS